MLADEAGPAAEALWEVLLANDALPARKRVLHALEQAAGADAAHSRRLHAGWRHVLDRATWPGVATAAAALPSPDACVRVQALLAPLGHLASVDAPVARTALDTVAGPLLAAALLVLCALQPTSALRPGPAPAPRGKHGNRADDGTAGGRAPVLFLAAKLLLAAVKLMAPSATYSPEWLRRDARLAEGPAALQAAVAAAAWPDTLPNSDVAALALSLASWAARVLQTALPLVRRGDMAPDAQHLAAMAVAAVLERLVSPAALADRWVAWFFAPDADAGATVPVPLLRLCATRAVLSLSSLDAVVAQPPTPSLLAGHLIPAVLAVCKDAVDPAVKYLAFQALEDVLAAVQRLRKARPHDRTRASCLKCCASATA